VVCVVCVNSEVGVGRSSTEPIRGGQLPKVLATEPWDGKDGEVGRRHFILLFDDAHETFAVVNMFAHVCRNLLQ